MKKIRLYRLLFIFLFVYHVIPAQEIDNREFRGVWIATVNNIDWPSRKNLSSDQQKQELIKMLELFKNLNFNAIIFQIRPAADAFYNSKFEPWSSWLNGKHDKAPLPYYDPLAFAITETHKLGMEFHAWLNPYRAIVDYEDFRSNPLPLVDKNPEWFVNYGKNKYFNPGIPEVRLYTNKVVADIVQNYDVDAIHFDDYFYPYKIENVNFPDDDAFQKYGAEFYPNKLDDWRRENVTIIIEELFKTVKSIKPWVQFGISPFGVWRNKSIDPLGSDTDAGQTNYDDLYADILLWLKNGWLDYVLPQAYWHIGFDRADYKKIVSWWAQNNHKTNLYIGQAMYRQARGEPEAWTLQRKTEIEKQLDLNKSFPTVNGTVYFSAKSFFKNPFEINQILKRNYYTNPLLPPSTNHDTKFIPEPVFKVRFTKLKKRKYQLSWESIPENKEKEAVKYLVFKFNKNEKIDIKRPSNIIALTGEKQIVINKKIAKKGTTFAIQAVSRNNNISQAVIIKK
ncbi:MAG: family 10 glycosylhydrolase [Aureibaculum sp.]|nr:family 10 glycosylhydrolase [Aureibaculum sp.]